MRNHPSIFMIEVVAKALGELREQVVFVGGSTVPLYIEDEGSQEPRPTDDVDCIINLVSYTDYAQLEALLRSKGFVHSNKKGDPICRWIINNVTVDVMPTDKEVIGFSNNWYKEGMTHATSIELPSKNTIKLFTPPYFIASKFEAFLGRGQNDFRTSHDFEDIITLLDGLNSFEAILNSPKTVRSYLVRKIREFSKNTTFLESISAHLEPGENNPERTKRILELFQRMK